ncbi:helix-turn-helix domain-containing protein [Candidatus Poribacteria bacterium]|nr:helix-turn-helix domain-containing protein [Candidatus Poribacteria bacterium]
MEKERMLSIKELTETINVSRSTVIRWIIEGKIKALKFGRQWRFKPSEISQWLKNGEPAKLKKSRFSLEVKIKDGQVDEEALNIYENRSDDLLAQNIETENGTPEIQQEKRDEAIRLIRSWREGNEQEHQETWEYLKRVLDND